MNKISVEFKRKIMTFFLLIVSLPISNYASTEKLVAAFRERPPEMEEVNGQYQGALVQILNEAAQNIDCQILWQRQNFNTSVFELKKNQIDIIPRILPSVEREQVLNYIGPIGYVDKSIKFLVKKGQEGLINSYEDLQNITIGVKPGAYYFEQFQKDKTLKKFIGKDDDSIDSTMAMMFMENYFQAMAIIDQDPVERVLNTVGYEDYGYANYHFSEKIGIYVATNKDLTKKEIFDKLALKLNEMRIDKRLEEIYKNHGITLLSSPN